MAHDSLASDLLAITREYLTALETDPQDGLRFFAPDVIQEEFPNRLVPDGSRQTLAQLREAAQRRSATFTQQRYELLNAMVSGNQVAAEVRWSATLRVPIGSIAARDQLRARFAIFLEFRGGLIVRQRNYDCFEPFDA